MSDLRSIRDRMLAFSKRFDLSSKDAAPEYAATQADPLMADAMRLGALTIDRAISTAATFSVYRDRRSGEWDPDDPSFAAMEEADQAISLSQLREGDLRFLVFLDGYFEAPMPSKVIEYYDSHDRKQRRIPVSSERAEQIDAFKAIASDFHNLRGMRSLVQYAKEELDQPVVSQSVGRA